MGRIRYSRLREGNQDRVYQFLGEALNPNISVLTQLFSYSNGVQVQMRGRTKIFYEMVSALFYCLWEVILSITFLDVCF